MSNETKSSFYNGNDTVYTDTNPPGPSDAPMTSPDGAARSSFYEGSGQQYAAIDLADQSVADVENNAAQATMMEAYAQSAAGVAGAFLREAHRIYASIKQTISNAEARFSGFVANAVQAARQARKEAASGAETVRATLAGYLVSAQSAVRRANSAAAVAESSSAAHAAIAAAFSAKARRAVEEAAAQAQSAISSRVAEAASYAKKALQDYSGSQAVVAALTTLRGAAEMAMRQAKQYAATAELAYQNAMAAVANSWGWARRSAASASASATSASNAATSEANAATDATNAANSASAAATSAASVDGGQLILNTQVFN